MVFDIVIPTYKRLKKLKRCLASIGRSRGIKDEIHIYIWCDNYDRDTYRAHTKLYDQLAGMVNVVTIKKYMHNTQYRAFGIWNFHLSEVFVSENAGMFYLCDDVELEPDCLRFAIAYFKTSFPDTDGIVGLNQQNIQLDKEGYSMSAMGLIGHKFAVRYPNMQCFCPDYVSFHADAELGSYARKSGKFVYAKDACLTHYHPAFFPAELDETHKIVREPEIVAKDREVWNERQRRGLLWGESLELIREEVKK